MIKSENFITIQGWMTQLDLKGNELIAYALIYGFSQDGKSFFQGTSSYISEWLGVSKVATLDILKRLVEKKYIIKQSSIKNNVTYCNYRSNKEVVNKLNHTAQETLPPPVKKLNHPGKETLPPPGKETLPHIINTYNKQTINTKGKRKNTEQTKTIHDKLVQTYGEKAIEDYYERIQDYSASTGKTYKDLSATARNWIKRDLEQGKGPKPLPPPKKICPACGSPVNLTGCNICLLEVSDWGTSDLDYHRGLARKRGYEC